nr:MAG TPA: hypothetical protein [Caudoviricetes sp.]
MSTLFTGSLSRLFLFPLYGYRFGFIVFFLSKFGIIKIIK